MPVLSAQNLSRFFRIANSISLVLVFFFTAYSQPDEAIIVDSTLVVMNATIIDARGKPVSGLKKEQFSIFEDGLEQRIELFAAEETPFAAAILIDTSGSMEERVSLARSAAIQFLYGLRAEDVAAIYTFDSRVESIQDFSGSRDIAHRIFDKKADGMTALNDAIIRAANDLSRRPEKRKAIVVLSDGEDTISRKSAESALRAALEANALIYTVDMSTTNLSAQRRVQNQGVLKKFAEKTGGIFVPTPGGAAMREAFKNIAEELGVQYTLGYQPPAVSKDGKWHHLELKVNRPNLTIRTRKGYQTQKKKG
ncbi:MAG: VWA domain-containing protein [Pyrinomonadaceae bacterium]